MVFGQLVILSDTELHLMTSNPEYIPILLILYKVTFTNLSTPHKDWIVACG